jgi:RimJ/RimL family protein N-acetyltransferase
MLIPGFPLRTPRLVLRPYTRDDLDFLHELESHPDVVRYVSWAPRDREQAHASLAQKIAETALAGEGDNLTLLITLPGTGKRVGDVQLGWTSLEHRQGEIGYVIHPDHTGHGYATEAASLMLRLGFEDLGLHRIAGRMDGRNTASARVLERLGMRREACLLQNAIVKGEWTDEVVYAMLADEWRARRPGGPAAG